MAYLHNLTALNFLAIGIGAAFGAWTRWLLGMALNPIFITLPLGTLAANLAGGYLVGMAVGLFAGLQGITRPESVAVVVAVIAGICAGMAVRKGFKAPAGGRRHS